MITIIAGIPAETMAEAVLTVVAGSKTVIPDANG
jgi:hypothetical protein